MPGMSEPKMTLDYQPPTPPNRGKIWLILEILIAVGFVLAILGALGTHVTIAPAASSPAIRAKFIPPSTMPSAAPATSPSP